MQRFATKAYLLRDWTRSIAGHRQLLKCRSESLNLFEARMQLAESYHYNGDDEKCIKQLLIIRREDPPDDKVISYVTVSIFALVLSTTDIVA